MNKNRRLHPLLTKGENKHYDTGKETAIEIAEKNLTVREMIGACVFNELKYSNRDKGQDESDKKKFEKYRAYRHSLQLIPRAYENTLVVNAYEQCKINWNYEV